ncbi:MAG TPA: AsmA family protein [Terriglobia bacterium]|nr:AsmA family protein [Terriglobia bacterium]
MRKIKILAGVAIALIVVVLGALWLLLDVNRYRPQIQTKVEEQLQRKVTLGNMKLGFFPVRFTVQDVTIAEDPSFTSSFPFTQAKQLDIRVSLLPLLSGNVQVNSIDLQEPSVELIRNGKGVWNFASLAKGTAPSAPSPAPETAPSKPSTGFSLGRLSIRGGKIAMTDLLKNQPRMVYEPIDITLLDYAEGRPFSFDITAHVPGEGSQEIHVKGTGGPLPAAGPAAMPLHATLSLSKIDIAGLRKFLDSEYVSKAAGILDGETKIESESGKLSAKGKLNLKDVKVGAVDVGYPVDLDFDLSSEVAAGLVQVTAATLKLGATPISVTGTINTNPTPMEVDLRLKSGEVSIAELARLASAFGIAFAPDTTVTGKVATDVGARGAISNLALNGNVSGRDLQISGKNVAQPINVKELNLALTPTEIQSNEFQATTGKTTVTGRVALRQYMSKSPAIDASLRTPAAAFPEIQSIARAYGVTGLDQLSGAGALNFDLKAAGPLESVASANVLRALNGKINLNFDTLKIQGFDASNQIATIGGFLKSAGVDKGFTEVLKLSGLIAVKNGIAETSDLEARLNEGTLAVVGKSDLPNQTLDARATAILSKAFSDKVGGTGIGGYLKTALANEKGELLVPVIISGNLTKPKFAPDTQALLRLQTNKLLPGLDDPQKALTNMLDIFSGKKKTEEPPAPGTPPKEQPKPSSLKDALEGIFGGKK